MKITDVNNNLQVLGSLKRTALRRSRRKQNYTEDEIRKLARSFFLQKAASDNLFLSWELRDTGKIVFILSCCGHPRLWTSPREADGKTLELFLWCLEV